MQSYLDEERETFEAKPNSWEHALFQALANDAWFIDGGLDAIE